MSPISDTVVFIINPFSTISLLLSIPLKSSLTAFFPVDKVSYVCGSRNFKGSLSMEIIIQPLTSIMHSRSILHSSISRFLSIYPISLIIISIRISKFSLSIRRHNRSLISRLNLLRLNLSLLLLYRLLLLLLSIGIGIIGNIF